MSGRHIGRRAAAARWPMVGAAVWTTAALVSLVGGAAMSGAAGAAPAKPDAPAGSASNARQVWGSWSLVCGGANARCALTQAVARDRAGRQVVLGAVILQPPGSQRLRLDFRLSPQALAQAGIGLKVGTGAEYRLPMNECNSRVCLASGWIEGPLLKDIDRNQVAQVAFLMDDRKQVLVPLSLGGLREAVGEMRKRNAAGERAAPIGR